MPSMTSTIISSQRFSDDIPLCGACPLGLGRPPGPGRGLRSPCENGSSPPRGYQGIGGLFYQHETISHSAGEYVRDGVSTNDIESVWAVLKRGVYGVYHHVDAKHLGRYVDEFTFRLNDGNVKRHTMQRLDSLARSTTGRRITYKELTA